MAKKGTKRSGRGTAKKGGNPGQGETEQNSILAKITGFFPSLPSWSKSKETPVDYSQYKTQTVTDLQQPSNQITYTPNSPNRLGGKKRKPTLKGGDGVTGHTQSGVATGAYKIGGRTRKQRKSRKSRKSRRH